eukprot:scaffold680_cov309-Prasinococcus_capsulatus_cf.AAC.8
MARKSRLAPCGSPHCRRGHGVDVEKIRTARGCLPRWQPRRFGAVTASAPRRARRGVVAEEWRVGLGSYPSTCHLDKSRASDMPAWWAAPVPFTADAARDGAARGKLE